MTVPEEKTALDCASICMIFARILYSLVRRPDKTNSIASSFVDKSHSYFVSGVTNNLFLCKISSKELCGRVIPALRPQRQGRTFFSTD